MNGQSIPNDAPLQPPRTKAADWRVLRRMAIRSQHVDRFQRGIGRVFFFEPGSERPSVGTVQA